MSHECADLKIHGWSENKAVLDVDDYDSCMELLDEY